MGSGQKIKAFLWCACALTATAIYADPVTAAGPGGPSGGDGPGLGQILLHSNFGSGGAFDTGHGWIVGGGFDQVIASVFASSDVEFAAAQLAMFSLGGTTAHLSLLDDQGGAPGAIIDTLTEQDAIVEHPSVVTFTCNSCPTLHSGHQYWLVATEGDGETGWDFNSVGETGGFDYNNAGSLTGPWTASSLTTPVFEIDGTLVPEPGSIGSAFSVLLAVVIGLRRSRSCPN